MEHVLRACLATCAFTLLTSTGSAQHQVRWDCYLRGGPVDCVQLGNAYFDSVPGMNRDEEGLLTIEVRSTALANARRYNVRVSNTESNVVVRGDVLNSRGPDQANLEVLALLQQATMPFLRVSSPGSTDDGVFRLEAAADEQPDVTDDSTNWYFRPRLGGNMFRGGITVARVNGGLTLNYSNDNWRFLIDGSVGYRFVDFDLPDDQSLKGGFVTAFGRSVIARSLGRGFSAALIGRARREPQNNLELRGEAGAGLEWVHRPFMENDATNIGLRYQLLAARDRYVTENRDGDTELWYPRHSMSVFGQLHGDNVDINADVGIATPLVDPEAWSVWGGASLTVRVAAGLEVTLGGNMQVRRRALNEPADFDELDPVTSVEGRNLGRLTYGLRLNFAYTFGNGLLHSQDRRWR